MAPNSSSAFAITGATIPIGTLPLNRLVNAAAGNHVIAGPAGGGAGAWVDRAHVAADFPSAIIPIASLAAIGAGNLLLAGPVGGGAGAVSARALAAADVATGLITSAKVTPGGANLPWALISTTTSGGGSTLISLTSIPATYTHLLLQIMARTVAAANSDTLQVEVNGDSAAHYDRMQIQGSGAVITSGAAVLANDLHFVLATAASCTAGLFALYTVFISNYANTGVNKTSTLNGGFSDSAAGRTPVAYQQAGMWESTAAINRIDIIGGNNFVAGTQVSLYGLS